MLTDQQISEMTIPERAELARRLIARNITVNPALSRRPRSLFLTIVIGASITLIPWIVFLAISLPKTYIVKQWTAVWTGFDIALLLTILACLWAALNRRQVLIIFAIMGATLLICDAWFDIMTASTNSDQWVSVASAAFGEIPFAILLLMVARRLLRLTMQLAREQSGAEGALPPLYKVGLLGIGDWEKLSGAEGI